MALFVILGLMTVAAMALLVVPLLRGHGAIAARADYDIEIYRDQLAELGRDVERGVIDADEQASARTEIQRRMLAADSGTQDKPATNTSRSGILAAFAIMMALPLAAGSLYLGLGSPGVVERPFADRPAAVVAVGVAVAVSKKDVGWNLLWSWAMVGLVAPYFPALFQRKMSMMLVVPWAILGAIGLAAELQRLERQPRNLVAALALAAVCMTSVFWLRRDLELARLGVSKTLMHNTYLTRDEAQVVEILDEVEGSPGVLAMPGAMHPELGNPAYLNDLAPVLSGLAGAYSYAGHWSETPDYLERRNEATRFYIADASTEERRATLREWGIEYVVAPVRGTYAALPLVDLSDLGETVYQGQQLSLIRVR
ncbi:MAG: c-type cytochrome biogenesis protein CcmI [Proteobacteria bacterium]|nr:c-type cytochrome biogenesis protein CcmI [Pseudomonadota bacterium]